MATKYEQQLIQQYGDPMAQLISAERAKGKSGLLKGSNVDQQDIAGLETAFKASDVFKAPNIAQTVNQPAQLNLGDLLGVRSRLEEELGYKTAQQDLLNAKEALSAYDIGSQQQQSAIGQRLVPMEVLRGEQATAGEQRAIGRQSLVSEFQAKSDLMSALGSQLETRFGIYQQQRDELANLMTQAPGAGITFTDTIETAAQKLGAYQEKTRKEQEDADRKRLEEERAYAKKQREDEYNAQLKATARELGLSLKTKKGGTMNTKQLEEAIGKKNKEALAEAKAWEKEQMNMERAKFSKSMSDAGGDNIKSQLAQSILAGEMTRESARTIYELQTGKKWDVYKDIPDGYQINKQNADLYDPITGKKIQYDEQGRPYIEE